MQYPYSLAMSFEPIHGYPAIHARDINALIVADLHIGIEYEMFKAGARIPGKTKELKGTLVKLLEETGAKTLVIAGDLKHNIPVSSFREEREIPELVHDLLEIVDEIHLTPGNHDGGLRDYLPEKVQLHSAKGFSIGDYGIWHGHCWPSAKVMASKTILMGHVHPQVVFVDGVEARHAERCWARGRWTRAALERYESVGREWVMIPAFNDLCGGSHVNAQHERKIGTVLRNGLADIRKAELYLLDGTNLGKVRDNLVTGERRYRANHRRSKNKD